MDAFEEGFREVLNEHQIPPAQQDALVKVAFAKFLNRIGNAPIKNLARPVTAPAKWGIDKYKALPRWGKIAAPTAAVGVFGGIPAYSKVSDWLQDSKYNKFMQDHALLSGAPGGGYTSSSGVSPSVERHHLSGHTDIPGEQMMNQMYGSPIPPAGGAAAPVMGPHASQAGQTVYAQKMPAYKARVDDLNNRLSTLRKQVSDTQHAASQGDLEAFKRLKGLEAEQYGLQRKLQDERRIFSDFKNEQRRQEDIYDKRRTKALSDYAEMSPIANSEEMVRRLYSQRNAPWYKKPFNAIGNLFTNTSEERAQRLYDNAARMEEIKRSLEALPDNRYF